MKIGIGISSLGSSQLSYYAIRSANQLLSKTCEHDIVALYENPSPHVLPMLFASMQFSEAWAFDGVAVSTNLSTAEKLLTFPCLTKRLFYVWDLEWLRLQPKHFQSLRGIYANPDHVLVARSNEHSRIISDVWNVPVNFVVEDTNLIPGLIEVAGRI